MKRPLLALLVLAGCSSPSHESAAGMTAGAPQDMPGWEAEPQAAEHAWLQRAVGQWDAVGRAEGEDGAPMEVRSTETVRAVGDYWTISEHEADMFGTPFTGVLTLGYDPQAGQFIGTWLDSTNSTLWHYTGHLDATGNRLTLDTEGPLPWDPERTGPYRESLEFTGPDSKVFTSSVRGDDGAWIEIMRIEAQRRS